jgi:L-lactate dehydrogenase complex protein LldE
MRIGLFIPCYIDAFFPEVGIATLDLLERLGHEVVYPRDQPCCGLPMANSGFNAECADTEALFRAQFLRLRLCRGSIGQLRPPRARQFRRHRADHRGEGSSDAHLRDRRVPARLTEGGCLSVGSVSASRGIAQQLRHPAPLKHATPSELHERFYSKPMDLLSKVEGIEFVTPARPDECCGFGGTFSVF